MTNQDFTCAHCGIEFEGTQTEEEAMAEYNRNFGKLKPPSPLMVICDVCYKALDVETHAPVFIEQVNKEFGFE